MKAVFAILVLAALAATVSADVHRDNHFKLFQEWTATHGKVYESSDEHTLRFEHFRNTLARIEARNTEHGLFEGKPVFGLTKFSDLHPEEFKAKYLTYKPSGARNLTLHKPKQAVRASSIDWRDHNVVTPVKDQGQCGSCWAFSIAEEMESMNALHGSTGLQKLSVQQLVSCDQNDGGCNGGDPIQGYSYVQAAGGLTSESSYPYVSGDGYTRSCNWSGGNVVGTLSSWQWATQGCYGSCDNQDESTLMRNIASTGPASVCVNAEPWQDYVSGVMSSGCSHSYSDLDHCVQLVGYGNSGGSSYYLVRNSWADNWGYGGYIYLKTGSNVCGIANEATFTFP